MPRQPLCFERRWQRDRRRRGPSALHRSGSRRSAPRPPPGPTDPDPGPGGSHGAQSGRAGSRLRSALRPRQVLAAAGSGWTSPPWQLQEPSTASDRCTEKEKPLRVFLNDSIAN